MIFSMAYGATCADAASGTPKGPSTVIEVSMSARDTSASAPSMASLTRCQGAHDANIFKITVPLFAEAIGNRDRAIYCCN